MAKMNPFDIINDVTYNKVGIIDENNESDYSPFMVNRGLSYFPDTIFYANMMNEYPNLDYKLQFDFLLNIISKRKRFAKWSKPDKLANVEAVSQMYNISLQKAEEMLAILTDEQVEIIKSRLNRGGKQ